MSVKLYLYCEEKLVTLKKHLNEYKFYDIAYFLDSYENLNDLKLLNEADYDQIVVDISDLIRDGNYFKIFTARYIRTLSRLPNVFFCMRNDLLCTFETKYPFLCVEYDIDAMFSDKSPIESTPIEMIPIKRLELFIYKQINDIKAEDDNSIVSLSDIIDTWDNLLIKYNIHAIEKTISEKKIEYIDISSVIKTLKIRNDLILQFEILLHKIGRFCDVKFCINSSQVFDLNEIFPLLFQSAKEVEESTKCGLSTQNTATDLDEIETKIENICHRLKGHDVFKVDLRNNLIKYQFLNQMNERKILSIMICGESGIGKTEFAKIASDVLFPDEPLIKINFGNYSTEGVLNSLIGAPLGYIGSEEGGELINKIQTSKSKVILIDEFEKATPSVYNFFYELLEDGVFTDRHGTPHNLNGYIIVFTSNMSQKLYQKHIPDSLKSRFDMVYYFLDIPLEEKQQYINDASIEIIEKFNSQFGIYIDREKLVPSLNELMSLQNLREIKRKIEDIVFLEFLELYKKK